VCLRVFMNVHVCVHMYAKCENRGFALCMYVCIYVCRSVSVKIIASFSLFCDSCRAYVHCVCVCVRVSVCVFACTYECARVCAHVCKI